MIYATTGQIGSGKDTAIDILNDLQKGAKLNISDLVREEAQRAGIGLDRDSLTDFTEEMLELNGPDYFINKAVEMIKSLKAKNIFVSGIRSPRNAEVMRGAFGSKFRLIAIETKKEIRFQRILKRASEKDNITATEFSKHDEEQERIFAISKTMKLADFSVLNNNTKKELTESLSKIIKDLAE